MLKKAVSPLIASVLLIVFVLVLGSIIMNFTRKSTIEIKNKASDKIEKSIKCSLDISIDLYTTPDNEKYICYNRSGSNNLELILENKGEEAVKGIRLYILDYNDSIKTASQLLRLSPHNITKYNISINQTDDSLPFAFPPSKIIISPILDYSGSTIEVCSDNSIEVEEVEECS